MKAQDMLSKASSSEEIAKQYALASQRAVQDDILYPLEQKITTMEDDLFQLKQLTIETDKNRGMEALTINECKSRFKEIVKKEYELSLVRLELSQMKKSYEKYFGESNN